LILVGSGSCEKKKKIRTKQHPGGRALGGVEENCLHLKLEQGKRGSVNATPSEKRNRDPRPAGRRAQGHPGGGVRDPIRKSAF